VPPLFGDTNLSGKNSGVTDSSKRTSSIAFWVRIQIQVIKNNGVILKYATQIQVKELAVPHLVSDTKSSNKN
jgi:hypothetical protein